MTNRPLEVEFCVLRAPLLSVETMLDWSVESGAPEALTGGDAGLSAALDADRVRARQRLLALLEDPQIQAGLAVASPDLLEGIARWHAEPDSKAGRKLERSLVRYVTRAAARPDLFGLAGAYTVGRFDAETHLCLNQRSELVTDVSVDAGLLRDLVREAAMHSRDDGELAVRRSPAIYRAAGRLRTAARQSGTSSHRLLAVPPSPPVLRALEAAADGASVAQIRATLELDGLSPERSRSIVSMLLDSDMLLPVAELTITGNPAIQQVNAALAGLPRGEHFRAAATVASDAAVTLPIGLELIDTVRAAMEAVGVDVNRKRCVKVDSRRGGDVRIGPHLRAEMERAIELLAQVAPPRSQRVQRLMSEFEARFGTRTVPLLEAFDPDVGIALEGPRVPPADVSRRRSILVQLLGRGLESPDASVVLTEDDLTGLCSDLDRQLPDSFALSAAVERPAPDALANDDLRLVEPTVSGPSGARLLGRFCAADHELARLVRRHLQHEEAQWPDVIYAELSVAPETNVGVNVTQRPVLRDWEIEYTSASGAAPDRRLPVSDLTVGIHQGEFVLRSLRLGRRVIPSCTNAMNLRWLSLPAARFLMVLSNQSFGGGLEWSWDGLADAPRLPRITRGRTVLARGRWNVTRSELDDIKPGVDAAGYRRLQTWRAQRGIPPLVTLDHPRHPILVDFASVLSVDTFLADARALEIIRFVEAPGLSPVTGPDGTYAHRLVVPFINTQPKPQRWRRPIRPPGTPVPESERRFPPGGEWLYVNLYGPRAVADRVLVDHIGPLVASLRETGQIDRWFFIRYADPAPHLRVRFHGRANRLLADGLRQLSHALSPAIDEGLLHRTSVDTYEREVERYGGLAGVQLMEQIAEADSDAVLGVLRHRMSAVERRHLAAASLAGLYTGSRVGLATSRDCCARLRQTWATATGIMPARAFGASERDERPTLTALLAMLESGGDNPRLEPLRARAGQLASPLERLQRLAASGELSREFEDVLCSLAHMSVNRLLKRGANDDEVRVHDALARFYDSRLARERQQA